MVIFQQPAELASLRQPKGWESAEFPEDFAAGLGKAVDSARRQARCAIWGAGAKGAMFAHYLASAGVQSTMAIDINTGKQGKFLAGSGVRVSSPDAALAQLRDGDLIYIMNSNYLGEIRDMSSGRFSYCTLDRHEL